MKRVFLILFAILILLGLYLWFGSYGMGGAPNTSNVSQHQDPQKPADKKPEPEPNKPADTPPDLPEYFYGK